MEEQADRHRHLRDETLHFNLYQVKLLFLAQVPPPNQLHYQHRQKFNLDQPLNQLHYPLNHQLHCQHHKKDQSITT